MLREISKPASELDEFLSGLIDRADVAEVERVAPQLPGPLTDFLLKELPENNFERWRAFARLLAQNGLPKAALVALNRAIDLAENAADKIAPYADKVDIERGLGMSFSAAADARVTRRLQGQPPLAEALPELAEADLSVVCVKTDPEWYGRLLDSVPDCPLFDDPLRDPRLTRSMFIDPTYIPLSGGVEDFSFFVVDGDGTPLVQCECDVAGDRYMGCREAGIQLVDHAGPSPMLAAAQDLTLRQLALFSEWAGCPYMLMDVGSDIPPNGPLGTWLRRRGGNRAEVTFAWIDLSKSQEEIEAGFRDAHRQSLRWGRKNVVVSSTNDGLSQEEAASAYFAVHAEAARYAGLRPDRLNQLLADRLVTLYVGHYEGKLAAVLISSRHGTTTYYMAAAKALVGNKPLSHVLLYQAVLDAKAEGQRRFDFGMLHTDNRWGAKLRNIAFYKKGYTKTYERRLLQWAPL